MVQISNDDNVKHISDFVYGLFSMQKNFTTILPVNSYDKPCLYSIWHAHQLCLHEMRDHGKVSIMISRSNDGEIIARVTEKWGIKTIRGSQNKIGSIEATKTLVSRLQSGESGVITVDGPRGPAKVVKKGIVRIAQMANVPIVPLYMYSPFPNLLKLPSWDKLRMPFLFVNAINFYGEPIYINPNATDEELEEYRLKVQQAMNELEKIAPQKFKEVFKFWIWKKKKH